jgi:outer membrane protein OmpA-like peptidoglycan-associated protein
MLIRDTRGLLASACVLALAAGAAAAQSHKSSDAAAPAAAASALSAPVSAAAPDLSPRVLRHELDRAEALLRARLHARPDFAALELVREPQRLLLRIPALLLFEPDSTALRSESAPNADAGAGVLDLVGQLMRRRPRLVAQVVVYTDAIGDAGANRSFSEQRAQSLITALESPPAPAKPLDAARFMGLGGGETPAADSNETPAGREHNRRVEIAFGLTLPAPPTPPAAP